MAGTFGSQLAQQQQDQRVSRTQRKAGAEQERIAQYNFEQYQKEAERLRTDVFVDKQVQEKYYIFVPREYVDRYGNISSAWNRMSDNQKESVLRHTSERDRIRFERTREVTDPFTFDEYGQEYSKLDPNIQQFFLSPTQITEAKEKAKQEQRDILKSKIEQAQIRLQSERQRVQDHRDWWDRQTSKYRSDPRHRESYNESMDDRERDVEEVEEWISYANGEAGKIDQGASANDIWSYAQDKADYNRERRENRSKAIKDFNKTVKTGNMDADLLKLGLNKQNVDYNKYVDAVTKYNKNVDYVNQLKSWASKSGYSALPEWAKAKINPSAVEWQGSNPTEKLQFDKAGNVIGVQSGKFGQTMTTDQYNAKIQSDNARAEKMAGIDTTLKLGEKKKVDTSAVMTIADNKPFTTEQIRLNELYSQKSVVQKGFDWVKNAFGFNQEATTPKIEYQTTSTAPQGMGGHGTAIIKTGLTPASQVYVGELFEFNQKADKLSEEIFTDYEAKISALKTEDITPEKISAIKVEQQTKFNSNIDVLSAEFSKDYSAGIKKVEREASVKNWGNFGLGGVVSFYHGLEDKDQARKDRLSQDKFNFTTTTKNWLPNSTAGTLMYNQTMEIEKAKKLSPTQQDMDKEALKDFSFYREKGMPIWLAKELTSGEQIGKGVYYGGKEAVYYNPRTIAFKTGAFATAVAGATVLATYSSGAGAVASSSIVKWGALGLTGIWAGSVIVRTSAGSTEYERGKIFGDIAGKEILPMIAGGYVGRAVGVRGVKWYENYKTMKQNPEWIASYKRVRMEVLRAEQNFPTEKTSKHLSEFQRSKFSLVTDEKGSKLRVTRKFKILEDPKVASVNIDFNRGVVKFGRGYTAVEKTSMLKTYFGDKYSIKVLGGRASLTKYLPKEAWNKFGVSAGSHATTSGRFAKVGERYVAGAGSSELPAQYFSSEDSLYFALGKGQSSSLYGGSLFGSAVAKPYVEAFRSEGFVKIPKNYHPKMTKTEVVAYLKKYAPDYPLRTITRSGGSYWKEAEFMIQRGRTGELVVIGRKSEIEAGKLFGTVGEREAMKPYFTKVMKPEIYKDLTEVKRLGRTEFVWQVKPLTLKDAILMKTREFKPLSFFNKLEIKPLTNVAKKFNFKLDYPTVNPILKYRIGDLIMGRQIGAFKKMKFGEIVPIERYKAIPQTTLEREQHVAGIKEIMKQFRGTGSPAFQKASAQAFEETILTKKIKQVADMNIFSSSGKMPKSSITYAEEYASMISFPKKSYSSPSASYKKSYSSLMSSIKSIMSSDVSSGSRMKSSSFSDISSPSMSSFSSSFDYWSGSSYKKSTSYKPPYYYPKLKIGIAGLKEQIRKKRKVTPEMMGLFPDFTARSIGIAPTKVKSVKDALKEMSRIQTGFEVRKGLSFKGSDKNIMRGIPQ